MSEAILFPGANLLDTTDTAVLVADGVVAWRGSEEQALREFPGVARQRLYGRLLTPAFVDAHVHATAAGLALSGLDLSGCRSVADCLDAITERAARTHGALIWGHGWDETRWPQRRPPNRAEVDRAALGAPAYLSRVDVHSALVSTALLDRAPRARTVAGWSEHGPLSQDAHHEVREVAKQALPDEQRHQAQRAFLRQAAAHGIAAVHECAGPVISGEQDLAELLALGALTGFCDVVGYWGELNGIDTAVRLGAHGAAGDLFVDGALGSRTAALCEPYTDDPGNHGARYLDAAQIAEHVRGCTEAGIQAGFHVIGDAAVAEVLEGFERAAAKLGAAAVAAGGHRLEHLEMVDAAQARRFAALGVTASMQPMFDRLWGGTEGSYAARLGPVRGARLNPFDTLREAGVPLAFGSDAPVTAIGPWPAVHAAATHRTPGYGIGARQAFAAHTAGGWRAAGVTAGTLQVGAPATFAIWETSRFPGAEETPRCLRTVLRGETIHDTGDLEEVPR